MHYLYETLLSTVWRLVKVSLRNIFENVENAVITSTNIIISKGNSVPPIFLIVSNLLLMKLRFDR